MDFYLVSKYLNELNGLVSDIRNELAKSKENILGIIKKPRKKQVLEELEKLTKNSSVVRIKLMNSSITMPESSKSKNFIKIQFSLADIEQSHQKI